MFSKQERSTFPYWFAHWCAFQMTALNCRRWKFKYLFHDIEKPWLKMFLPYSKVQTIHRAHNRHHPEWLEMKLANKFGGRYDEIEDREINHILDKFDYEGAIIDWESCHHTKAEQPLNAYQEWERITDLDYLYEKYPNIHFFCSDQFRMRLLSAIRGLGLDKEPS